MHGPAGDPSEPRQVYTKFSPPRASRLPTPPPMDAPKTPHAAVLPEQPSRRFSLGGREPLSPGPESRRRPSFSARMPDSPVGRGSGPDRRGDEERGFTRVTKQSYLYRERSRSRSPSPYRAAPIDSSRDNGRLSRLERDRDHDRERDYFEKTSGRDRQYDGNRYVRRSESRRRDRDHSEDRSRHSRRIDSPDRYEDRHSDSDHRRYVDRYRPAERRNDEQFTEEHLRQLDIEAERERVALHHRLQQEAAEREFARQARERSDRDRLELEREMMKEREMRARLEETARQFSREVEQERQARIQAEARLQSELAGRTAQEMAQAAAAVDRETKLREDLERKLEIEAEGNRRSHQRILELETCVSRLRLEAQQMERELKEERDKNSGQEQLFDQTLTKERIRVKELERMVTEMEFQLRLRDQTDTSIRTEKERARLELEREQLARQELERQRAIDLEAHVRRLEQEAVWLRERADQSWQAEKDKSGQVERLTHRTIELEQQVVRLDQSFQQMKEEGERSLGMEREKHTALIQESFRQRRELEAQISQMQRHLVSLAAAKEDAERILRMNGIPFQQGLGPHGGQPQGPPPQGPPEGQTVDRRFMRSRRSPSPGRPGAPMENPADPRRRAEHVNRDRAEGQQRMAEAYARAQQLEAEANDAERAAWNSDADRPRQLRTPPSPTTPGITRAGPHSARRPVSPPVLTPPKRVTETYRVGRAVQPPGAMPPEDARPPIMFHQSG